ncbi:hypothetical protein AB6A40_009707 [Gnathostoma spinigerum]|uniref:Uncharacterized protein n=1 Tax=Gnathostoma spinigerum TaxID=75299 RepID=A0ABD6ET47_9BILA
MASRYFLITVISELSSTIDVLSENRPLMVPRPFGLMFPTQPLLECVRLTILGNDTSSSFEIAYRSGNRRRSIIGRIIMNGNRLSLEFAPMLAPQFCIVTNTMVGELSSKDAIVLAQSDMVPSCTNHLVLSRHRTEINTSDYYQLITRLGGNTMSNLLVEIPCESFQ